jgi:hypothetical protein
MILWAVSLLLDAIVVARNSSTTWTRVSSVGNVTVWALEAAEVPSAILASMRGVFHVKQERRSR